MNILSIVRITTVVGLSAIKLISTALKVKEAKQQGLINPIFANNNNSTPYMTQQPMMNNGYNSQPMQAPHQPTWSESRRFMNTNTQPVYNNQTQYQQAPMMPNYDAQSRRYNSQPVYNPTTYIPSNWQSNNYRPIGPTVAQYNHPEMMSINNYDSLSGWCGNRNIQRPIQQSVDWRYQSQNQELKWCDKSYGQMMEERQMQYQPQPVRHRASPMFNWNSPWLKYDYAQEQQNSGVVAMFSKDDGTPLYGPALSAV